MTSSWDQNCESRTWIALLTFWRILTVFTTVVHTGWYLKSYVIKNIRQLNIPYGCCDDTNFSMTSPNGKIFRVTGHLCREYTRPVNSPHKGQWRVALMFFFICAWKHGWVKHREAGDLRRHHAHYDVTVLWRHRSQWGLRGSSFFDKACLTPEQNGRQAADDVPKCILVNDSFCFYWCFIERCSWCSEW